MNNTFVNENNAPQKIMDILEHAYKNHLKIRFWYGDKLTGKDWGEIYDTFGYVGKSCGYSPIPILLKRNDSIGGCAILTDCIVKITIDHETVYKHPNFNQASFRIEESSNELKANDYYFSVYANDINIRNCKTKIQAQKEIDFHLGKRNAF